MTDEGGVLGNLPNSRPGRRSAKRDRPANAARKAAVRAEAAGTPAAEAEARVTSGRRTASKGRRGGDGVDVLHDMDAQRRHDQPGSPGDALGAAVRGAAGAAVSGVKVAGAVTQELLRRLPRP